MNIPKSNRHVIVVGAGPAGLTAAYLLSQASVPVTVLEADPTYVGGISRTVTYRGFHFDIGGHRFFSKSKEVEDFWTEILGPDLVMRPRLSRIYYRKKFFDYPIKPFDALEKLGLGTSVLCLLSYVRACLFPVAEPRNFEQWVTNQFGRRLFRIFFKTYTEKVWGMSCDKISADWAAQRIKGLSLSATVIQALFPWLGSDKRVVIKTLIDSFRYPRKGPGMMWQTCAERIRTYGGAVQMGQKVVESTWDQNSRVWTVRSIDREGRSSTWTGSSLISSAPLGTFARELRPALDVQAITAASRLSYRDFLVVALIVKDRNRFSDNWIYVHDPGVKVGRIQNFKSWSPDMVPDPSLNCYGMEYFCFEGDGLWNSTDHDLIALATAELLQIGLCAPGDVIDGCVVRQQKAYPVYDEGYLAHLETLKAALRLQFPTLYPVGRNGMHHYDNQDHAMMTAMLSVRNILAEKELFDPWQVNQDAEYIEGGVGRSSTTIDRRDVPRRAD